ncbi:helix-turn-helix domain-containing protein [Actinomyces succiniciruminis]|uniref:helix-turn-helix domain-containing protein n=1 Tax=Actinomyces succiniciruminis TaxID=1522002 RepID=UPI003CC802C9
MRARWITAAVGSSGGTARALARRLAPSGRRFAPSHDGTYLPVHDSYSPATARTSKCRTVARKYESAEQRYEPSGPAPACARTPNTAGPGINDEARPLHPSRQRPPPPTTPTNAKSRFTTLTALCDALDCTVGELLEVTAD